MKLFDEQVNKILNLKNKICKCLDMIYNNYLERVNKFKSFSQIILNSLEAQYEDKFDVNTYLNAMTNGFIVDKNNLGNILNHEIKNTKEFNDSNLIKKYIDSTEGEIYKVSKDYFQIDFDKFKLRLDIDTGFAFPIVFYAKKENKIVLVQHNSLVKIYNSKTFEFEGEINTDLFEGPFISVHELPNGYIVYARNRVGWENAYLRIYDINKKIVVANINIPNFGLRSAKVFKNGSIAIGSNSEIKFLRSRSYEVARAVRNSYMDQYAFEEVQGKLTVKKGDDLEFWNLETYTKEENLTISNCAEFSYDDLNERLFIRRRYKIIIYDLISHREVKTINIDFIDDSIKQSYRLLNGIFIIHCRRGKIHFFDRAFNYIGVKDGILIDEDDEFRVLGPNSLGITTVNRKIKVWSF